MSIAYITNNSTKEDIYKAYIKAQKLLKMQRHINKVNQDKVKEVRKEKNKRYNELRYKMLKQMQINYGIIKHLNNSRRFAANSKHIYKKMGFEQGRLKVKSKDYSVIKMYTFLLQVHQVCKILKLQVHQCAFILWAGRYSFFNIEDYNKDWDNNGFSYHVLIAFCKRNGLIIDVNTEQRKKQYALNAVGLDLFNKLSKFTNNHFKDNE